MVKQFYTSVRAAFKSVPLPFIHIYHPASFFSSFFLFQSTGTTPLLTTSLQISVTHFTPASPPPSTYPPPQPMAPPLCHSLPWLLLALLQTLILIFHPPMLLPYSLHQCYQYYLCSNQIPHSAVAHNILSIFALSLLPPLQFSHLPPSHIHSQQCLYSTQPFA